MNTDLSSALDSYLGETFFWNYQPNSLWYIQGVLDLSSDCPKIFAVHTEDESLSAIVPGGLFRDSVEHGLLRISDNLTASVTSNKHRAELCRVH